MRSLALPLTGVVTRCPSEPGTLFRAAGVLLSPTHSNLLRHCSACSPGSGQGDSVTLVAAVGLEIHSRFRGVCRNYVFRRTSRMPRRGASRKAQHAGHSQRAAGRSQEAPREAKLHFDGNGWIEDFLHQFKVSTMAYQWDQATALSRLQTALVGEAADCRRPGTVKGITAALQKKFGRAARQERLRNEIGKPVERCQTVSMTELEPPRCNGRGRVEKFLDQFQKVVMVNDWDTPTALTRLRASLVGGAADC